jgi:uracil-DNA glycosylase
MKVLFVGANPSPSNKDATIPFEGTRSGIMLHKWQKELGIKTADYINVTDAVTKTAAEIKKANVDRRQFFLNLCMKVMEMHHGQPLATLIMSAQLQMSGQLDPKFEKQSDEDLVKHTNLLTNTPETKIIALGKLASWAMDYTGQQFYELPHPSGLNRKVNDKDELKKTFALCKNWLYSSPKK